MLQIVGRDLRKIKENLNTRVGEKYMSEINFFIKCFIDSLSNKRILLRFIVQFRENFESMLCRIAFWCMWSLSKVQTIYLASLSNENDDQAKSQNNTRCGEVYFSWLQRGEALPKSSASFVSDCTSSVNPGMC